MSEDRRHPEVVAADLRKNPPKPGLQAAASRRVCLSSMSGRFRLSWSASSFGTNDWVGLYASSTAPDSDYIGGAWQWASRDPSFFDTSVPVTPNYQARYLIWNASAAIYQSVARTPVFPNVTVYSIPTGYPRKPTSSEWSFLVGAFPGLSYSDTWVTGPLTQRYNCIAWSLGLDDRWINPDSPLSAFENQYQAWGQKATAKLASWADADGWGTSTTKMTHGSKTYQGVTVGVTGLWESKLGGNLRITHGRQQLTGANYGQILASFELGYSVTATEEVRAMGQPEPLLDTEKATLNAAVEAVPADLKQRFNDAFAAWERTWFAGELSLSSDTRDRARGPEFEALEAMGAEILPLIVEKLLDVDSFVALVLYDAIQQGETLQARYTGVEDPARLEGEQVRARRTVHLWIASREK